MITRPHQRGFTLIEILVVIFIVATISTIALLSISTVSEDEDLETERRRFASLAETIRDEATMQGREFGIEIMRSSYRFVEFDPLSRQWAEVPGDDLYRLRRLPEGLEFELYIDDKLIQLLEEPAQLEDPDDEKLTAGDERFKPHLFVFASGEASVYELHVWRRQTDSRLILRGDVLGQIKFAEDEDDEI